MGGADASTAKYDTKAEASQECGAQSAGTSNHKDLLIVFTIIVLAS
jgi:hypothetical protein